MARPRLQSLRPVPWASDPSVAATRDAVGRPLIRLQTLGAAVIQCGESRVGPSAGVLFALLLRLTHAAGMQLSRDALLDALWPDQPEGRRRGSLRQALYKLRGAGVRVALDGDAVRLDGEQVVRTFSIERTFEHFDRDVTRGNEPFGPFLPGYVPPFATLDEWLTLEREAVHADVRRVLVAQLRARRERADWTGAEALARWLLQFDTLHEDATLTIAECTMMAGAKTEAIAMIDRYLAEIGPNAGDIRLPAEKLRRRFVEATRGRLSFAPTERHFVGREEEVAALTIAMRRARWHDGSAVLLHGPPGMGKTRLTYEVAKVATIEGIRELRVRCRESDRERTLAVLLDLLPELLALPGALGCAPESMTTLRRLVPTSGSVDVAARDTDGTAADASPVDLDGAYLAILTPDESTVREPVTMAASIRRAIIDLVCAVSEERPLFLVIDDVHWIDADSWDVIADMVDRVQSTRVLLLMTSREPHARSSRPERVPPPLVVRELQPLSAASGSKLARLIGDDLSAPISEELCTWFIDASEGSPLFLRSLVNHWIETGEAGGVPPTLAQAIEQRLAKLTPEALRTLQAIVLLGENASVERIKRVLEINTHDVLTSIDQLERLGALAKSTTTFVVAHDLISIGARARLSPLVRSVLHDRIGDVLLVELPEPAPATLIFQIAEHLRSSGDSEKFCDFVTAHLAELSKCGSPTLGLALIDDVLERRPELVVTEIMSAVRSRLRLEAGEYAQALGERPGSVALMPIDSILTDRTADEVLSVVDSSYRAEDLADRNALSRYAFALSTHLPLSYGVRLRAAEISLVIASNTGDAELARDCFAATGIDSSDASLDEPSKRVALIYHTMFGDRAVAYQLASSLASRALEQPLSTQRYHDLCRAGYAFRFSGSRQEVVSALEHGFITAQALSLPRLAQYPAWQLAAVYMDAGMLVEAERWNNELMTLFQTDNDGVSSNFIPAHFCRVAIATGDHTKAQKYWNDYSRTLPRSPVAVAVAYWTALKIGVHLLDSHWIPERELLDLAYERYRQTCSRAPSDLFTCVLARALARCGLLSEARSLVEEYIHTNRREALPPSIELALVREELRDNLTAAMPDT